MGVAVKPFVAQKLLTAGKSGSNVMAALWPDFWPSVRKATLGGLRHPNFVWLEVQSAFGVADSLDNIRLFNKRKAYNLL